KRTPQSRGSTDPLNGPRLQQSPWEVPFYPRILLCRNTIDLRFDLFHDPLSIVEIRVDVADCGDRHTNDRDAAFRQASNLVYNLLSARPGSRMGAIDRNMPLAEPLRYEEV